VKTRLSVPIYVLAIAGLLAASYTSLRLARADARFRNQTPTSLRHAIQLAPDNAEYPARLASMLEAQGDSAEAVRLLDRAAVINPNDSRIWISLGLLSESLGEYKKAEQYLLGAARVDRMFDPRWTLANFYYRTGDATNFWLWVRKAAEISYENDDLHALFRLCWAISNDGRFILERIVPEHVSVQQRYLSFLLGRGQLDEASQVAQRLMPNAGRAQTAVLLDYCERLVRAGRIDAALTAWNTLVARKLIQHALLVPNTGASLTNGSFIFQFLGCCFDWRPPAVPEILWTQPGHPPRLELRFSGKQPEAIEVLSQVMPVLPAHTYRFQFEYRTSGIATNTGLRWSVFDYISGAVLQSDPPYMPSQGWNSGKIDFRTTDACRLARLVLSYRREPGTTRIAGSTSIRNLALRPDTARLN
jgi:tetratricopeptide (TPR) repeat protein